MPSDKAELWPGNRKSDSKGPASWHPGLTLQALVAAAAPEPAASLRPPALGMALCFAGAIVGLRQLHT